MSWAKKVPVTTEQRGEIRFRREHSASYGHITSSHQMAALSIAALKATKNIASKVICKLLHDLRFWLQCMMLLLGRLPLMHDIILSVTDARCTCMCGLREESETPQL